MKISRTLWIACVVLLAGIGAVHAQTWTPLTHQPIFSPSTAMLLTDGTVMVQETAGSNWWKLTPDSSGSYINGTWSRLQPLPVGYAPLYYASAVLPDGRVLVMGGEYNEGVPVWIALGAIYNPKTDNWRTVYAPSLWGSIGDAQSTILSNGKFMLANCCTGQDALFNPHTLQWTPFGAGKADVNDEEGWTLLPNGKVLTVDASNGMNSELFDPATGVWSSAGSTLVQLADPASGEVGPAVLRPDGTVFATGGTGHNAVYNTITGTWSVAPDFPQVGGQFLDIADGPAALLPNGNVLMITTPGVDQLGAHFFEWDGTNLTEVPSTPDAAFISSFYARMLVLPTGQILFTDGYADVEIYTSPGSPNPAWAPTITKVTKKPIHGRTYKLEGTQLNGLSQGTEYGDDAQAATNYPLVRITNNATGHVFYAGTKNHSSMGVATGSAIVSTHFTVPVNIELGASQLVVVANGIASDPVSITIN